MFKKDFWKYFINTYKNAKLLIVRFFVVAIYLSVTSIIANKMNLHNLTYYNAIIGLAAFSDLIGFGISNGVGIFINQNINDKKKVDYYTKIGLYLNIIFSAIFVILLGVFYKPILHSFLGLAQNISYSFYFIMLVYIFLNCVLSYLVHTLKELKTFFAEAIVAVIQCFLLVVGFIALWLRFDLSLILIPIIYIVTTICALIFAVIFFNKNKTIQINMLKFVKMKFVKSEAIIIWRMAALQIVWQVGYSILAYFILRVSEVFYNQYAYFENVLDIFNGFFFSFVTITSIDICRKLGEGNFDETYKIGKYSLYSTVVIWFLYFALSFALSIPLIKGMSMDTQSGALIALVLYVGMHFFRFLSWNLIAYILCWGGELKILIWQEVVATGYYIGLYFLAPLLPVNIYLTYVLITIPVVAQTILGLIIFKRKNWMKKISQGNK